MRTKVDLLAFRANTSSTRSSTQMGPILAELYEDAQKIENGGIKYTINLPEDWGITPSYPLRVVGRGRYATAVEATRRSGQNEEKVVVLVRPLDTYLPSEDCQATLYLTGKWKPRIENWKEDCWKLSTADFTSENTSTQMVIKRLSEAKLKLLPTLYHHGIVSGSTENCPKELNNFNAKTFGVQVWEQMTTTVGEHIRRTNMSSEEFKEVILPKIETACKQLATVQMHHYDLHFDNMAFNIDNEGQISNFVFLDPIEIQVLEDDARYDHWHHFNDEKEQITDTFTLPNITELVHDTEKPAIHLDFRDDDFYKGKNMMAEVVFFNPHVIPQDKDYWKSFLKRFSRAKTSTTKEGVFIVKVSVDADADIKFIVDFIAVEFQVRQTRVEKFVDPSAGYVLRFVLESVSQPVASASVVTPTKPPPTGTTAGPSKQLTQQRIKIEETFPKFDISQVVMETPPFPRRRETGQARQVVCRDLDLLSEKNWEVPMNFDGIVDSITRGAMHLEIIEMIAKKYPAQAMMLDKLIITHNNRANKHTEPVQIQHGTKIKNQLAMLPEGAFGICAVGYFVTQDNKNFVEHGLFMTMGKDTLIGHRVILFFEGQQGFPVLPACYLIDPNGIPKEGSWEWKMCKHISEALRELLSYKPDWNVTVFNIPSLNNNIEEGAKAMQSYGINVGNDGWCHFFGLMYMIELVCTAGIGFYRDRLVRFVNTVMNRDNEDDSEPDLDAQVNAVLYTYALAFKLYKKLLQSKVSDGHADDMISKYITVSYQKTEGSRRRTRLFSIVR